MAPLGLVESAALTPQATTEPPPAGVTLRMDEVLASAGRLWVRGQLVDPHPVPNAAAPSSWWPSWSRRTEPPAPSTLVRLETRIGGQVLTADVPITADGRFEALFSAALPPARRGWRIARHHVTCGPHAAEKCSAVLTPPADTRGAALVLLPWVDPTSNHAAQRLAASDAAARLTPVLRRLHHGPAGDHAFYFIACVPPGRAANPAELALATTALGWPGGTFVLLPQDATPADAYARAVDRLRWLFAGSLDLVVLSLESSVTGHVGLEPKEDRAPVRSVVGPGADPWAVFQTAPTAPVHSSTAGPRRSRASLIPHYPVVFCHGMLAFSTLKMAVPEDPNCFTPLKGFLRERGFRALFPRVEPTGGVAARAAQLRAQITAWTDEPINLVAHSMGGLDARYLITHLGMADRVKSLTTIASPHRGTYLIDWFIANFRQRVPLLLALEAMGFNVDGFHDCRPCACRDFNAATPDMPGVRYFSYGGAVPGSKLTPVLRRAWSLLNATEGPNDGMVSLASARWGEYLGTIQADHFAQTPDMTFVRPNEDFDALGFYLRLLEDLARRGF